MSIDAYYSRYALLRRQLDRANATWHAELVRPVGQDNAVDMITCNRVIADLEQQIDRLQEQADAEDAA
jgi:hypothetical protein